MVDWLTLETQENKGLIFSRGCALSVVENLENQGILGLISSGVCALLLVDWLTLENRENKRLNFFKVVCAFSS